ncbi:TrwC relaxase [Geodermatophilus sp. DF01-2]|nr:TrwC relaxase [Geodermatophilus sp. DF01_2]
MGRLWESGYRDPDRPVDLDVTPVGTLDRDHLAGQVLTRLAAGRSAWNAADIRGEVEQLIAAAGIVVDPAVRIELAEDLTARALTRCTSLLPGQETPEHVRAWTSRQVLDVEADLTARLADRSTEPDAAVPPWPLATAATTAPLDAGQAAAVAMLAGEHPLVVVEGAAGSGKTTTLSATRDLLDEQGRRLVVVTPTLKAAQVAAAEVGAAAGSAAWLVFHHGWRWTDDGTWTRLISGQADPTTGAVYTGPEDAARLSVGDLLVVDETGMLDQDTARALLTVADESGARVALLGDRQQLAAVGRGGVLELAVRAADPAAVLPLGQVHRFIRTDSTGATVPDGQYAELTLTMRTGADPGAVFDALAARGQIQLHHDAAALREALAAIATDAHRDRQRLAVVVDTREQAGELNAAVRDRSVADGRVDDTHAVTTGAGQRIGVGDRIATRRNDRNLGVANRDTWAVTAVDAQGNLTVTPTALPRGDVPPGVVTPAGARQRILPAGYVTEHVELAYATTVHGAQGDTVLAAHLVVGERTGAAAVYVGMTRGRESNNAHLVAADLTEARQQWITAFGRDRADLGPAHAAELAAQEAARYAQPRPPEAVLADLHAAWTGEQRCLDRLASAESRRDLFRHIAALEASDADRLTALDAASRTTAADAERARARVETSAAVIATETGRRQEQLLAAWDAQRDAAHRAAQVVLAGPGWLGRRRAAVARAEAELTAWADTWRAHVPGMPDDPTRVAVFAAAADDRPRLQDALADDARRCAESAHPEHPRLVAAARTAEATADRVQTELVHARRREEDRSLRAEMSGDRGGPTARLADAERDVAAAARELAAARARVASLRTEPALLGQPDDRLPQERERWSDDYAREAARLRAAQALARPPAGRWGDREPVPSYAAARDRDRGVPR